jgi:hypothetical protein
LRGYVAKQQDDYLVDQADLAIRVLNIEDAEVMASIEEQVWDCEQAAPPELIALRLAANPGSSLGAFVGETQLLVGFMTFVRTFESDIRPPKKWSDYANLALKPWTNGDVLYGIDLTVGEDAPRGTATRLVSHFLQYGKQIGVCRAAAITRAPHYHLVMQDMPFSEYYRRLQDGSMREPLYHLMISAGLHPVGFCPDYYPDKESADFGLAFEADLRNGLSTADGIFLGRNHSDHR